MNYQELSLQKHAQYKGKFTTEIKVPMKTKDDLATYYSPGVAAPCLAIQKEPEEAYTYTSKNNTVAIISDGSAVLWLWNIGGLAWLPVMEGKAALFKRFANVDGVPIVLQGQDVEETIKTIINIAPTFGGINIEDIKAPQCFAIEKALKKQLDIPVYHDDQHGTAVVTLAGIINALTLTDKKIEDCSIVMSWAWAAGIAIAKLLHSYGARDIVMYDSRGAIYAGRENLNPYKESIAHLNKQNKTGTLSESLVGADIFIGISQPDLVTAEDVQHMADKPIVFAMANPNPEITPAEAEKGGVFIMATGRSDYPNQVNNVLAFPGIFRGALDAKIPHITQEHNLAAAHAIANFVTNPTPDKIVPSALEEGVAEAVAQAVKNVG